MKFNKFNLALSLASALLFVSASSPAQTAFPLDAPTVKIGDSWSYRVTDAWKNEVLPNLLVRTVTAIDNYIRFTGTSTSGIEFKYSTNKALNIAYMADKELQLNKIYFWPLTESTVWENKRKEKIGNVTVTYESECKVRGIEKVTVPAGTFDAVKYVCKGFYNNDNVRSDGISGGNGYFTEENWYAPSVKQNVKTTSEFRHGDRLSAQTLVELASFKVQ